MRAFLSHSSKDKGYVEDVASFLRPGTYELDSETFDRGLLNAQAIETALKRSTLFVLFLSEESVRSGYVNFEIFVAREFYAQGTIERILVICLDDTSFEKASETLRFHNFVRKPGDSASSARLITSFLISASNHEREFTHPFLNRETEIKELQDQIFDHLKPPTKAFFLSGNQGAGRRSLSKKIFSDQYPQVTQIFPEIDIEPYDGPEEIHRKIISKIKPTSSAKELRAIAAGFQVASEEEKCRQIADIVNSLLPLRESMIFNDLGGAMADDGSLEPVIDTIVGHLIARPHPPLTIIAPRMVPRRQRREPEEIAYCAVKSLSHDTARRLVRGLLKAQDVNATDPEIEALTVLGEGHPYNYYRIIAEIRSTSLQIFLNTSGDFVEWKHRKSSDYVKKLTLSLNDVQVVSALNLIPQADFETLTAVLNIESDELGKSLEKLIYDHIVEFSYDLYKISPALRIAIERDRRFSLSKAERAAMLKVIAGTLTIRIEGGAAAIQLIDAAILAEIETASGISAFAEAFVLPSHYVWLARRTYDRQDFAESIRLARIGLEGKARLSRNGKVAACRYLCLSAARLGDDPAFAEGMTVLKADSNQGWTRSNIEFLLGFNERLKGNLPEAEEHLREALTFSTDNFSAARELAAVCAARGNLDDAESFAREARQQAPDNAYVLDILISVLIRRHGRSVKHSNEIEALFEALEKVGDEGGRSFYTTRRAEFEHLWGDNKEALRLIDVAVRKTPRIFDVHRLRAQILIKSGNTGEAWKEISKLREIVDSHSTSERRANYRGFVEAHAEYLEATGQFKDAKGLYRDNSAFTKSERDAKVKEIEIAESYARG